MMDYCSIKQSSKYTQYNTASTLYVNSYQSFDNCTHSTISVEPLLYYEILSGRILKQVLDSMSAYIIQNYNEDTFTHILSCLSTNDLMSLLESLNTTELQPYYNITLQYLRTINRTNVIDNTDVNYLTIGCGKSVGLSSIYERAYIELVLFYKTDTQSNEYNTLLQLLESEFSITVEHCDDEYSLDLSVELDILRRGAIQWYRIWRSNGITPICNKLMECIQTVSNSEYCEAANIYSIYHLENYHFYGYMIPNEVDKYLQAMDKYTSDVIDMANQANADADFEYDYHYDDDYDYRYDANEYATE